MVAAISAGQLALPADGLTQLRISISILSAAVSSARYHGASQLTVLIAPAATGRRMSRRRHYLRIAGADDARASLARWLQRCLFAELMPASPSRASRQHTMTAALFIARDAVTRDAATKRGV